MELIITLRKTVVDDAEADQLIEIVRSKLADNPDIKVAAQVARKIEVPEQ